MCIYIYIYIPKPLLVNVLVNLGVTLNTRAHGVIRGAALFMETPRSSRLINPKT